jgi:hypothetical protein
MPARTKPLCAAAPAFAVTVVLLLAGCTGASHKASAAPASKAPAANPSPPSCLSQFHQWSEGGGSADLNAVNKATTRDQGALSAPLSKADFARLAITAGGLQAAAQTAQADPPPACVPGLRTDWGTAMADLAQAAKGVQDGAQAAENGDTQTADSDFKAVPGIIVAGGRAMLKVDTDMSNLKGH